MSDPLPQSGTPSAAALLAHLRDLDSEIAVARAAGLLDDPEYVRDLALDMAATQAAYVGAAVTEIAVLRRQLDGPLTG